MLFPVYLLMFLLDVAIFFLGVRLLWRLTRAGWLAAVDRVGAKGVKTVTEAIASRLRPWMNRPLSRRQEEGVSLMVLCLARLAVGFFLSGMS